MNQVFYSKILPLVIIVFFYYIWLKNRKKNNQPRKRSVTNSNDKKLLDRNLNGIELEKLGKTIEAIKLYEMNISENFEGNHPYDRLSIIYRKNRNIQDEIRVLEKAIYVFENLVNPMRSDRLPKIEKFKTRLEDAKNIFKSNSAD